jgi:hypothetical protein
VESFPVASGWGARVWRVGWGGVSMEMGEVSGDKAGGIAWCERMAEALARDREDDAMV